MSADQQRILAAWGQWIFKGILSVAASLVVYVHFEMKDNVKAELHRITDGMLEIRGDMKVQTGEIVNLGKAMIRVEGQVETNRQNIERLERDKKNKPDR